MKKIGDYIANIIGGFIMNELFQSASPWQRFKWRVEDFFKR